jgi:hypothetical protein
MGFSIGAALLLLSVLSLAVASLHRPSGSSCTTLPASVALKKFLHLEG